MVTTGIARELPPALIFQMSPSFLDVIVTNIEPCVYDAMKDDIFPRHRMTRIMVSNGHV